jgi:hypothetical protein
MIFAHELRRDAWRFPVVDLGITFISALAGNHQFALVIVMDPETDTAWPDTMDVLSIVRSQPDVPIVPSILRVAPEVRNENQEAVDVKTALAPVTEFNVSTPPEAAGANVALQGSVTSKF